MLQTENKDDKNKDTLLDKLNKVVGIIYRLFRIIDIIIDWLG